jgi:hypothetical protein
LLDSPAEWDILAESEVEIDEEARLASRFERVGLNDKLLLPFRMRLHAEGDFFDEAILRETILGDIQFGFHGAPEASENDPSRYVSVPLRLEIKRFKTVRSFGKNPIG